MARRRNRLLSAAKKIFLVLLTLMFGYIAVLTVMVVCAFELSLNRWPTLVHTAPFSLKVGDDLRETRFIERLRRLGYVEKSGRLSAPAQWTRTNSTLDIFLKYSPIKDYDIISGQVRIGLKGSHVKFIRVTRTKNLIDQLTIEPELLDINPAKGYPKQLCRRVRLNDVSKYFLDAVVLTEDARFYSHSGIDLVSIRRALRKNLKAGRYKEGGSTIVQQLMRMTLLTKEKTLWRKLNEVCMALIADTIYSKERILEAYVNRVYFGHWGGYPIHGVAEASRVFFGISQRDLNPAQSALLAAIIRAPNVITPYVRPTRARNRRNAILKLMAKSGKISTQERDQFMADPAVMVGRGALPINAHAFLSISKQENIHHNLGSASAQDVVTSIDPVLQHRAQLALDRLGEKSKKTYLIIHNPQTGEIRSYIAPNKNYWSGEGSGIAPVLPIMIMVALKPDIHKRPQFTLNSQIIRSPDEGGSMTLREAFVRDPNFLARYLISSTKLDKIIFTLKAFGVPVTQDGVRNITVGPISPMDMSNIYSNFAVHGKAPKLTTLSKSQHSTKSGGARKSDQQVYSRGPMFLVNYLLSNHQPQIGRPANKMTKNTRSSTFFALDANGQWFVAFRANSLLTMRTPDGGFPQMTLLRLAHEFMPRNPKQLFARINSGNSIVFKRICTKSGLRATSLCPDVIIEAFLKGTEPSEWCPLRHH